MYPPGTHAGVLVARLPDAEQYRAAEYVLGWFERYDPTDWVGCLVVGTPRERERELFAHFETNDLVTGRELRPLR
jgi:hypothetical protein